MGIAEGVDFETFLQLPDLEEMIKVVNIRFFADGQDEIVLTVNVGESLSIDAVPNLTVDTQEQYDWELVPAITSEVLGIGELETVEYISEEHLTNILFDQTYEVSYGHKDTVIQWTEKNAKNRPILLAEGTFAKNTTIALVNTAEAEPVINGSEVLENWQVAVSDLGITKLHYLLSEEMDTKAVKLLVKDVSGNWLEREFVVDGSYMVFDFSDTESGFALVTDFGKTIENAAVIGVGAIVVLAVILFFWKKRKVSK